MPDDFYHSKARDDFNKARIRQRFDAILSILRPEKKELLSFYDVKAVLKPGAERYLGMMTVPLTQIVGSEGRYRDFDKAFLPKTDNLRGRWESVDRARLSDIILPPVRLYQIGGAFFVKDGNHRVSVARTQGVEFIDAEVTELPAEVRVSADMTRGDLKTRIIAFEKDEFVRSTGFDAIMEMEDLEFSEPGRFQEILRHIMGHKYYLNQTSRTEISLEEGALSWYSFVYHPVLSLIDREGLLSRFPGRTRGDLYLWTVKHWDDLKRRGQERLPFGAAARDFSARYGKGFFKRLKGIFRRGGA